jgi:8-oxo-dGTP pyrophosphatase MutT (NUDIX family)
MTPSSDRQVLTEYWYTNPMHSPLGDRLSPTKPHTAHDQRYCGAVLFDTDNNILLQVRDQKAGIANPGMTTLFGGGQNDDETMEACIIRELSEELALSVRANDVQFLGYVDKKEANGAVTRCAIFTLYGINPAMLRLREGRAIAIQTAEVFLHSPLVSEVTKMAIRTAIRPAA